LILTISRIGIGRTQHNFAHRPAYPEFLFRENPKTGTMITENFQTFLVNSITEPKLHGWLLLS
jgi:hypothetical protein